MCFRHVVGACKVGNGAGHLENAVVCAGGKIKLQQKRENIIVELRQIYLTLQREFENIATAESTIGTAQEAYDIAQVSFDNGVMTQLELRDTRLNLESAELNHLNAVYSY